MVGEDLDRKVRYFYVQNIKDLENPLKYSGVVFRVNELKGGLENLSGSDEAIKKTDFHFSKGKYVVDSLSYSMEEIKKAKALFIVAEQDKSGGTWEKYLNAMNGTLKDSEEKREN